MPFAAAVVPEENGGSLSQMLLTDIQVSSRVPAHHEVVGRVRFCVMYDAT
jgi:hypothetical protein